jgi:hypothetical protein
MSIGDLKTQGAKGTNYTYQLAVLKLLDLINNNQATEATLQAVLNQVTSKIDRIKGSADYSRQITYHPGTINATQIIHTGTTLIGSETITETITYVNPAVDGSNVTSVIYS